MATFRVQPDDNVHYRTAQWALEEFDAWRRDEANPVYQRLVKVENLVGSGTSTIAEKVAILDGTRNRQSLPRAAVRYEDLRYLNDLPSVPKAKKVPGATVTVEEFNRLVDDVRLLYERLGSIAMILKRNSGG